METEDRQFLLSGDTIVLNKLNMSTGAVADGDGTEFCILSKLGEGGSSVCYEARCEDDGTHGRLKEFYPVDLPEEKAYFSLERGQDNQLVISLFSESIVRAFEKARNDFKDAYCALARAKNRDFGTVLNNYISPFELYEGLGQEGSDIKSIYVWTRHDRKIMPFDRYIEAVKTDVSVGKNLERHLFNVLNAVLTLAKCIRALHTADLVHMDIKPSNFGVSLEENGQIDSSSISLYDVNTIYSAGDSFTKTAGTQGFRAPEVMLGRGGTRSDIYSVGATLFNAVCISDSFDGIYRDEYYSRIDSLVANSGLMLGSDKNSNSALHDMLVKILKNCLAHHPDKRYKACSYLVDDLSSARAFLLPHEAGRVLTELGREIKIVNIEEQLDRETEGGALGAIQRLLFERPLYETAEDGTVRALVLGAGTYAQRFIDTAFAAAQVKGCSLEVTAVSANAEADRERYLNSRPAFKRFFTVDNIPSEGVSLGKLSFVSTKKGRRERRFSRDDAAANNAIISDISRGGVRFSYVFVALGDDELNHRLALDCVECRGLLSQNSSVNFVWCGKRKEFHKVHPVFVNDVIAASPEYEDLKRMAFNCHCLWNKSLNVDLKRLKSEFGSRYNFMSSLSNALSIKYKLHSIGIEDIADRQRAAREFCRSAENNSGILQELAMYEHRRWLVCSICEGWDTLEDVGSLKNDTRDRKRRLHPCIVESTPTRRLMSAEWTADNHGKWDTATDAELAELDALDRASVLMHRHFKGVAEKMLRVSQYKTDIEQIRFALTEHGEALRAFELFVGCLNGIVAQNGRQIRSYGFYRDGFKRLLKNLPQDVSVSISGNLESVENAFYPILQSRLYTEHKSHDMRLVKGIPFILTYSTALGIVVPIHVPDNAERRADWFRYVAPTLVLDPKRVTFIAEEQLLYGGFDALLNGVRYMTAAIDSRNLQAKVDLVFLTDGEEICVDSDKKAALKKVSPRIGNIEVKSSDSGAGFTKRFKNLGLAAVLKNQTHAYKRLSDSALCEGLPEFSYDSASGVFETDERCETFRYVELNTCLKPQDMLGTSVDEFNANALLSDDGYFWRTYAGLCRESDGNRLWGALCDTVKAHTDREDMLLEFDVSGDTDTAVSTFYIPQNLKWLIEKLAAELEKLQKGIINNVKYAYCNASVLQVTVDGCAAVVQQLGSLVLKQHLVQNSESLRIVADPNRVRVLGNGLAVHGLMLGDGLLNSKELKCIVNVFKKLADDGYILGLDMTETEPQAVLDLCFPSAWIKRMLTNPEAALSQHVYSEALQSGLFDDCFGVFESDVEPSGLGHPFDLIAVKGFKSLIIECSVERPSEELYKKVLNTCRAIGINSKAVLVCSAVGLSGNIDAESAELIKKYERLGVATVFEPQDIFTDGGIAKALNEILNRGECDGTE